MEAQTHITFQSKSLLVEFREYLKEYADLQIDGYAKDMGIIADNGREFQSHLHPWEVLQRLCFAFDQVAHSSIQCGDMCLVDSETDKGRNDTPAAGSLTHHKGRCWYNVNVSSRVSTFSRSF